jgi:hypothetical protein
LQSAGSQNDESGSHGRKLHFRNPKGEQNGPEQNPNGKIPRRHHHRCSAAS